MSPDVKFGGQTALESAGFTTAVIALALGIGVNTAVFDPVLTARGTSRRR